MIQETLGWISRKRENRFYLIAWLIVFLGIAMIFFLTKRKGYLMLVEDVFTAICYFFIFLINSKLLVKYFLFREKIGKYLLTVSVTVLLFVLIDYLVLTYVHHTESLKFFLTGEAPVFQNRELGLPAHGVHPKELADFPPPQVLTFPFVFIIKHFLIASLMVGFNTSIKLSAKWLSEERKRRELEKIGLETELTLLKNQVSPHFLMNTLNNIHALIDVNTEAARTSIISLSKILRYQLYDSEKEFTTFSKEIAFINNFLELTRLRYTDNVEIKINIKEGELDVKIPPMLFIDFIENAFKHGVSYKSRSYVHIELRQIEGKIFFSIMNSIPEQLTSNVQENTGVGLEKIRKRLNLLYGDRYILESNESEKAFKIQLIIPVDDNKMYSN